MEANMEMGLTAFYQGEFDNCREHLNKSLALYDKAEHKMNWFFYGNDPCATSLAFDGFASGHSATPTRPSPSARPPSKWPRRSDTRLPCR